MDKQKCGASALGCPPRFHRTDERCMLHHTCCHVGSAERQARSWPCPSTRLLLRSAHLAQAACQLAQLSPYCTALLLAGSWLLHSGRMLSTFLPLYAVAGWHVRQLTHTNTLNAVATDHNLTVASRSLHSSPGFPSKSTS